MKFSHLTLLVITLLPLGINAQTPCKEVVGYYPGWQWYDRNKLVKPASIDYSKYTILQYAFMNMQTDGHLQLTDPWADKNLLLGDINWAVAPAGYDNAYDLGNADNHIENTNLAYYAHQNNVKLLMSVGGWTLSGNFSGIAADPTKRQTFATECAGICELYELDGIDIDWEYPSTLQDKTNYTILLQAIRDALDAAEIALDRELLLTAAVSASPTNMEYVEWDNVSEILDIINLMSYDFYGLWDPQLNHNSPLYYPGEGDPDFSCSAAVERLLTQYNVPADKLTMGMAFYGRTQLSNAAPQLFGTGNGIADNTHFGIDEGTPLYYNVLLQSENFDFYWDDNAKVPYAISADNNSFLSYDDEMSIGYKSQYIVDNNLRGAIIWEITGDYIETSPGSGVIAGTPLADKVNDVFCSVVDNVTEASIAGYEVYPNPSSDIVFLRSNRTFSTSVFFITNAHGQIVECKMANKGNSIILDIRDLARGIYFVHLEDSQIKFIKE